MKVWFDLTNSPHVSYFKQLINELTEEGHEVIVTTRPLGNTIQLLDLHGIKYKIIGTHYGKSSLKKIFGFPIRIFQLFQYLKKNKPDIAIAQASYYSPVVARLLKIYSIYTNDNEHAKGNLPAFICSNKIFIPEFLDKKNIKSIFFSLKKVTNYPGVKEGIYLWSKYINYSFLNTKREFIYIRLEPNLAQYYNGGENFLDKLIIELKENHNVVIIPRDRNQAKHYFLDIFKGVHVLDSPESFEVIASKCKLFIGAGGTMTREMAVIGIPTISVYQDNLLKVDQYLVDNMYMQHIPNLTLKDINLALQSKNSINKELLLKGELAYNLLKSSILSNKHE